MPRSKPTFRELIRRHGVEEFAERYNVSLRATKAYLYGERKPKPDSKLTRTLLEEGAVTWSGIYGS